MGPSMRRAVPDDFERMWRDLAPVGRSASSGGYFRQPFTTPERELSAWFVEQCDARGLRVESDAFGNVVGWWDVPSVEEGASSRNPAVLTGSHLDSVLDGGAYDGPLGVVSALAAIDLMRARGVVPVAAGRGVGVRRGGGLPLRAGLPRLPAGDRRDLLGVGAGADRPRRGGAGRRDRGRDVVAAVAPWARSWSCTSSRAATSSTAARRSGWRARSGRTGATASTSPGAANHAGTTRMEDRQDPMLTYAMTALAANKQARLAGQRATFGRVSVRAQRHQRRALAGDRLARRALLDRRGAGRAGRRDLDRRPPSGPAATAPRWR